MHLDGLLLACTQVLGVSMPRDSRVAGGEIFVDNNINGLFTEMKTLLTIKNFTS